MAATATLNVRLPEDLKDRGAQVLRREGVSVSDAVRGLYEYMEKEQRLPEFINRRTRMPVARRWSGNDRLCATWQESCRHRLAPKLGTSGASILNGRPVQAFAHEGAVRRQRHHRRLGQDRGFRLLVRGDGRGIVREFELCITASMTPSIVYLLSARKLMSRKKAHEVFGNLASLVDILDVTESDCLRAQKHSKAITKTI